jgi:hypothetical protein
MHQDLEFAREGSCLLLLLLLSHHHLVCMSEALELLISILEHELLKQDLQVMIQISLRVQPCLCH